MAENVLFLIHGVGNQKAGWSGDCQDFLSEEIKKYPSFRGQANPLNGRLHFEEIVYNDVLDDVLRTWKTLTDQFDAVSDGLMPGALTSVNFLIGEMAANGSQVRNNQIANRAADVLLYRGLKLVQRLVLLKVVKHIATVIAARKQAAGGAAVKRAVPSLRHSCFVIRRSTSPSPSASPSRSGAGCARSRPRAGTARWARSA